jgi:transcriptional regulator with XRE-family HTH domain
MVVSRLAVNSSHKKVMSLKEIREIIGLNQDELSVATGITTGHLANIENHSRNFTVDTAKKIADAISNMLKLAEQYGDTEKKVDFNLRQLSEQYKKKLGENVTSYVYDLGDTEKVITDILPELLIASSFASAFATDVRDQAYELLIDIEKKQFLLKYLKEHGQEYPKEKVEELDQHYKYSPAEILHDFLADIHYKNGLWGVLEELRDHIRRREGFFLSRDHDE